MSHLWGYLATYWQEWLCATAGGIVLAAVNRGLLGSVFSGFGFCLLILAGTMGSIVDCDTMTCRWSCFGFFWTGVLIFVAYDEIMGRAQSYRTELWQQTWILVDDIIAGIPRRHRRRSLDLSSIRRKVYARLREAHLDHYSQAEWLLLKRLIGKQLRREFLRPMTFGSRR